MIPKRFHSFSQYFKWLLIATLIIAPVSLGYQLNIMVEQHRLFAQIDHLARTPRQSEENTLPYDPWRDLTPLTTPEERAVAQQLLIEAQRLATATPYNSEAPRQLGRAAILAGRPDIAIAAFSDAVKKRPDSTLTWFELGMAYEQFAPAHVVTTLISPQTDDQVWEWLPPQPNWQEWRLPVRAEPSSWWVAAEPVARTVVTNEHLALQVTLPTAPVVLSFWMGTPTTQPATYQVMLDGKVIGSFTLSSSDQGWRYGYVDLAPWAGQTVVVTLQTNTPTAGWGDLRIVDPTTIDCLRVDCLHRAAAAWRQGGFTANDFIHAGAVAFRQQRYDESLRWFERAASLGGDVASTVWYVHFVNTNDREALMQSIALDRGWINVEFRLRAWSKWADFLHAGEQRFAEVEQGLRHLIETTSEIEPQHNRMLSEIYRRLALAVWSQGRATDALPYAETAIELNEWSPWAHIHYGKILYFADPERIHHVEQAFATALALEPNPSIWRNLIGFWRWVKDEERAKALCQQALQQGLTEEVQQECRF
ncbi:MAG: tetratricopeptide repeat protein [Anaerolineae bacterium]